MKVNKTLTTLMFFVFEINNIANPIFICDKTNILYLFNYQSIFGWLYRQLFYKYFQKLLNF